MAFKFVVFVACLAVARAGYLDYDHGFAAAPVAYAAPAYKVAAPAATSHASITQHTVAHAAPLAYAAPAYKVAAAPALSIAHAAPAVSYAAPALSIGHAAPALSLGHASYGPASYGHASYGPAIASYAAPIAKVAYAAPVAKAVQVDHYAPAHYDFEYAVHDPHTGDVKSQKEIRQGDAVQGSYSLIEADGSKRIVEYTADAHNGFNAVVHREPAQHPVAVKAVAPVVKAVKTIAAPALTYAHAAPAVTYAHAAPAVTYAHAAPAVTYGHAAPALSYAAAPAVSYAAAPALSLGHGASLGYAGAHGYYH